MSSPTTATTSSSSTGPPEKKLARILSLRDVYAISTGAMFSSGFFLLPGLAAAEVGAGVVLAYLAAGILALPAMFTVAELSTAMPRAGGAYFFLDRSLGPLAGTIGGLGSWASLVSKSAFALLGMGAYLVLLFDAPIVPLAIALTVVFAMINLLGASKGASLQRMLVYILVGVLTFLVAHALISSTGGRAATDTSTLIGDLRLTSWGGFAATVGMVFVSYAGLTKVASVAEEVQDPARNIPLGMILALGTATVIYVLGVAAMVRLLGVPGLSADLTPVASVANAAMSWLPSWLVLGLVVAAATAAFASTGNAGIMSASRYPMAMARDHLVPTRLAKLSGRGAPTLAIVLTALAMLGCIIFLDVVAVAKVASAFQLLLFALMHVAVLVMRTSGIEGYQPAYRSPFYPWMQIVGIAVSVVLISMMGPVAIGFSVGTVAICALWYRFYAHDRVERRGAIYHVFRRLGRRAHLALDDELAMLARTVREARLTGEPEVPPSRPLIVALDERGHARLACRDCGTPWPDPCRAPDCATARAA